MSELVDVLQEQGFEPVVPPQFSVEAVGIGVDLEAGDVAGPLAGVVASADDGDASLDDSPRDDVEHWIRSDGG